MRTPLLTTLALIGFAANSLLCRGALGAERIDAASFTSLRLIAGAATLWLLSRLSLPKVERARDGGSWASAAALALYAVAFSYAYLRIDAGSGALILFGAVQVSMVGWGIARGERPGALQWLGLVAAFGGLCALLLPGAGAPDALGGMLMVVAGGAWGIYSLRGRRAGQPLLSTARNFAYAVPFGLAVLALALPASFVTGGGAALAVISGAFVSGLAYSLWYGVLPALGATRAAVVQLTVPVLAALGGAALLGEAVGARLVVCGAVVLGGVALTVFGRARPARAG